MASFESIELLVIDSPHSGHIRCAPDSEERPLCGETLGGVPCRCTMRQRGRMGFAADTSTRGTPKISGECGSAQRSLGIRTHPDAGDGECWTRRRACELTHKRARSILRYGRRPSNGHARTSNQRKRAANAAIILASSPRKDCTSASSSAILCLSR